MPDLRKSFFTNLTELAQSDDKIRLLTGDLGFSFIEEITSKLPKQVINCGIAEQGMVGIAAGMALGGLKPYVYSGAIFAVMRPYEQLRDDICYNNLDVKIIGTGASGFLGFTHNLEGDENLEDLLKNLPNLKRFYPHNDEKLKQALTTKGPVFIKL